LGQGEVVYRSKKIEMILQHAQIAAETDATVLITGESGTGKTLLAKQIHIHSRRKTCPFIEISCGALSEGLLESELFGHKKGAFSGAHFEKEGKFEASKGGTIFLDDINSSSLGFQIKLLRVIEERVFERVGENKTRTADVRIVAATNVDLMSLSSQGKFREDLFHRLNVIGLEMPSLRERKEDIPALIHFFIEKFSLRHQKRIGSIEEKASEILLNYSWPGNVRELENVIERAVIFSQGSELKSSELPDHIRNIRATEPFSFYCEDPRLCRAMEKYEKNHITSVLKITGDNRSKAAELLNISRATLFNKMRKYAML
jgi:transcriptional regulator with PAS, ATPase and Fis domain